MLKSHRVNFFLILILGLTLGLGQTGLVQAEDEQFFPETGKTLRGKFLQYWRENGGLPVFGYPITDAQNEVDPETNRPFLTQWFERNRFELHPENAGTKYEVLLGLLGKDLKREALNVDTDFRYTGALVDPAQPAEQQRYFPETGHNLRDSFLKYWQENGGLERFGYPISELHDAIDPETGKAFSMQWFERARFEYHPENPPPYNILLGLLGNQIKKPKGGFELLWKIQGRYTQVFQPNCLYANGLTLYVCDTLNSRVLVYDTYTKGGRGGRVILSFGSKGEGNGQFNAPRSIVADSQGNIYVADRFQIQKFDKTGHFLLKWGSYGFGNGNFGNGCCGLALDGQGNIVVADQGNGLVQKFSPDGTFLTEFGGRGDGDGKFFNLVNVAVDSQGYIYTTDTSARRVQRFNSIGQFVAKWADPGEFITIDEKDNIYVGHSGINSINKYDTSGKLLTDWSSRSGETPRFYGIGGIAADRLGLVFVADYSNFQIEGYWSDGLFSYKFGGSFPEAGQFNPDLYGGPADVAVDEQGNLYVADVGNHLIKKFDPQGHLMLQWGGEGQGNGQFYIPEGMPGTPLHLAVDKQGNVFVADAGNFRVQKFDGQGRFVTSFGSKGDGNGQFSGFVSPGGPWGIAVDSQGQVYVTDRGGNSVQKFDNNGRFLAKFGQGGLSDGQFASPSDIVLDNQGNFYVIDDFRIQKFDPQGNFLTKFGNGGQSLALDPQGNVYVSGTRNGRIWKFDKTGNYLSEYSEVGKADGQVEILATLALDQNKNLYVADPRNNRIQKFRLP
jgi:sugar lactone lactonase YvrE